MTGLHRVADQLLRAVNAFVRRTPWQHGAIGAATPAGKVTVKKL